MRRRSEPHEHRSLNTIMGASSAVALVGMAGSVLLTLYQGQRNPSVALIFMFVVWVSSPFVALIAAIRWSREWSVATRAILAGLTLPITIGSLAIYASVALGPPRAQPAFFFLIVPLVSWLLIVTVVPLVAWLSRRR